jgi:hypothetical protein
MSRQIHPADPANQQMIKTPTAADYSVEYDEIELPASRSVGESTVLI